MKATDRFWKYVQKGSPGECWRWTGSLGSGGYGSFHADGRGFRAHRYSFLLHGGVIPEGLVLDHLCRVPACVNPRHLEPVTDRENIRRGVSIVAQQIKRTTCPRGHLYDYTRRGDRRCRACDRRVARIRNDRLYQTIHIPDGYGLRSKVLCGKVLKNCRTSEDDSDVTCANCRAEARIRGWHKAAAQGEEK